MCTRTRKLNDMGSRDYNFLIGLMVEEARHITERIIRVVERDGDPVPISSDYNPNRVNVAVVADTITLIHGIG